MRAAKVAAETADSIHMGPIGLSNPLLQPVLDAALKSLTGHTSASNSSRLSAAPATGQTDSTQLSSFAQLMNTLQQLQQSNPAKYQQVTQQIGANLQSAAQTVTTNGNTAAASQLNQLAADFTNASKSGQLPDVQDLAQAIGGHHHHHHAHPASDSNSVAASSSSSGASQTVSQPYSAFQSNGAQSASTDPMSIILNTLSNAGVTSANS
jgi:hypothetical protein